jgi:hypothetical protein
LSAAFTRLASSACPGLGVAKPETMLINHKDRPVAPQWIGVICGCRMDTDGLICAQKPPRLVHKYRREHRDQLSFKDFFLSFSGQLSSDNCWIKLADRSRGTNWKMTMQPSSARGLVLQRSHSA